MYQVYVSRCVPGLTLTETTIRVCYFAWSYNSQEQRVSSSKVAINNA